MLRAKLAIDTSFQILLSGPGPNEECLTFYSPLLHVLPYMLHARADQAGVKHSRNLVLHAGLQDVHADWCPSWKWNFYRYPPYKATLRRNQVHYRYHGPIYSNQESAHRNRPTSTNTGLISFIDFHIENKEEGKEGKRKRETWDLWYIPRICNLVWI